MMMNNKKLTQAWYPILPSKDLASKPKAVMLLEKKLVIVRLLGRVVCFDDYCPHRHVPLSEGASDGTYLQCMYHGWRFDAVGQLVHLPACMGDLPDVCLHRYACVEQDGWIWVNISLPEQEQATPQINQPYFLCPDGFECYDTTRPMIGDLIHAIENFLDPTHTPFVHKGLLRGASKQSMTISQSHDSTSFVTTYHLHQRQNGLINRLFDGGIDVNIARFNLPTLASIDYLKQGTLMYRIALFFVPKSKGNITLAVRVCIPKTVIPSPIKFAILHPFLNALLRQDQHALELHIKHNRFPKMPYVITPSDLVIDHLLYLLADMPEGVDKFGEMVLQ